MDYPHGKIVLDERFVGKDDEIKDALVVGKFKTGLKEPLEGFNGNTITMTDKWIVIRDFRITDDTKNI